MLETIDDVDWSTLTHAYGPADDVPDMLRRLASPDDGEAEDALDALIGSVFHQGDTYPATPYTVPILVDLALRPDVRQRAHLVHLVGTLGDAYGTHADASREALCAQVPRLATLLEDHDPDVRECAAYALGHSGSGDPAVRALRTRWRTEPNPIVRATLVAASVHLSPAASGDLLAEALRADEPEIRAAAVLAAATNGVPLRAETLAQAADAWDDGDPLPSWVWCGEPLEDIASALGASAAPLLRRLASHPDEEVRTAAAYAVESACQHRRSAPAALVPLLRPLLTDPAPEVRRAAAGVAANAGAAGALVANELAQLAADYPSADAALRPAASTAISALITLGDPRWRGPLLASAHRPSAVSLVSQRLVDAGVPHDPVLGDAVVARLRAISGTDVAASNERIRLVVLLGSWGWRAAAAVPTLIGILPHATLAVPRTLGAIGAREAIEPLRHAARDGSLAAGAAVWTLTGDATPLVETAARLLDQGRVDAHGLAHLRDVGEAARPLVPALVELLPPRPDDNHPVRGVRVLAADLVHRLTGDAAAVVPTLRAALLAGDLPAREAAAVAGTLGPVAASLEPDLRRALRDRWAAVASARTLHALGVPTADLVGPLLAVVEHAGHPARDALDTLVALGAREAAPTLARLAESDTRAVRGGNYDDLVREDEAMRERLREAVTALS